PLPRGETGRRSVRRRRHAVQPADRAIHFRLPAVVSGAAVADLAGRTRADSLPASGDSGAAGGRGSPRPDERAGGAGRCRADAATSAPGLRYPFSLMRERNPLPSRLASEPTFYRERGSWRGLASQIFTVPSWLALARRFPSGLKHTLDTLSVCPLRLRVSWP